MRATLSLSKGFWSRSAEDLKRYGHIVWNLDAIRGPSKPFELHDFSDPESLSRCGVFCDKDIGGYSESNLAWEPFDGTGPWRSSAGYARFHGNISNDLPKKRLEIQRTGYAAWRTKDRGLSLFGRGLMDIDPYVYLALRVKSDGRSYFVNVQTESIIPSDLHQHRLFAKTPGQWETVFIKWNDFVRTNHGHVVEPQTEILRHKVRTLGLGLTDRVPGPFEICIAGMWATLTNDEREIERGATKFLAVEDAEQDEEKRQAKGSDGGRDGGVHPTVGKPPLPRSRLSARRMGLFGKPRR